MLDYDSYNPAFHSIQSEIHVLEKESKLTRQASIKTLDHQDVEVGVIVGVGRYSRVFQVKIDRLDDHPTCTAKYYALKCLRPETRDDGSVFPAAFLDMVAEADLLSRLNHANVIKIHAIVNTDTNEEEGGPSRAGMSNDSIGYSLVLDLLPGGTLLNKINRYRQQSERLRSFAGFSFNTIPKGTMIQRLRDVAQGIAKGLLYLHENNIVLRDLKPDNIGFDENDTPKLFDFGLARELHMVKPGEVAGSLRYMSPEASMGHSSHPSVDVYSFGLVLYQLLTLKKPFARYGTSEAKFCQHVYAKHYRPSTSSIPSHKIRALIEACWHPSPQYRPTMDNVVSIIQSEIDGVQQHPKQQAGTATSSPGWLLNSINSSLVDALPKRPLSTDELGALEQECQDLQSQHSWTPGMKRIFSSSRSLLDSSSGTINSTTTTTSSSMRKIPSFSNSLKKRSFILRSALQTARSISSSSPDLDQCQYGQSLVGMKRVPPSSTSSVTMR